MSGKTLRRPDEECRQLSRSRGATAGKETLMRHSAPDVAISVTLRRFIEPTVPALRSGRLSAGFRAILTLVADDVANLG